MLKTVTPLTPGQIEAARLIAQGYSYEEIAETLCLSLSSVRNRISKALAALGLHSQTQLVVYALKLGLISLDEIDLSLLQRKRGTQ